MRRVAILFALFIFVAACADDETGNVGTNLDAGTSDASNSATSNNSTSNNATTGNIATSNNATSNNATTGNNATSNNATSNNATTGNNITGSDAGTGDDAGMVDMGTDPDMGGDPYAGRPIGQCVTADDCPENMNGKVCNRFLPGGACGACGNSTTCDDECFVGTCITTCGDDNDCPPGLECTGVGRCGAIACVNDVCPVPLFGCSESGLCARVDCSNGEACPTDTTCTNGVCAEDRALP